MTRTLLIVGHPRPDSLTSQVAALARRRLEAAGDAVDLLDLYAEDFDPRLTTADEPEWGNRDKRYSEDTHAHMRRFEEADQVIVVFPVWWFGPPAIVKGWIDRVWNYGFAYGASRRRLSGKRILWLGLAGGTAAYYEKSGFGHLIDQQLRVGLSEFCGLDEAQVRLLYGAEFSGIPEEQHAARAAEVFGAAETALTGFGLPGARTPRETGPVRV
ncbi:NAD(P)H oxidoreductase [Streptomyces sp. NPDC097619]|uniref:NAD(P)H oxidoreductase n=1 Tax=Streptomyces sp. NPDC097619 TaxID=3157228 RepID=UPI00332ABA5F